MAHQDAWDKFWKNKDGDIVVYQHPNFLLIGWLILTIASLFAGGNLADDLWYVGLVVLGIWSLLEILRGVNYLRRLMGVVVLLLIIVAVFKLA